MKHIKPTYLKLLCFLLFILFNVNARASHIVGMDLYYTWVAGNTYKVTLVAYGDCGSAALTGAFSSLPGAAPQICVYDGNTFVNTLTLSIQAPSAGVEITPVCAADINNTQCTNTSFSIPGIKKFVYSANYTVPHTSSVWRFMFLGYMGGGMTAGAGRAGSITNIASGTSIELTDTLNNTTTHNSSPLLTVVPTPFFCLNNSDNYNPGAVDVDADSLAFFLVPGMGGVSGSGTASCISTGSVTYLTPFSATAPLATTTFSFDQHTGQISFFPNALQRALVVYNVREYRGGVVVGTSQREMTFLVLACTNIAPSGGLTNASNGTIVDSTHFKICANAGPFTLDIDPTSSNPTNNITVTYSGLPTGCTFTTTGNGTPTPHCVVSWTSTGVTPGSYTFYVTYTDDNCPLSGTQTLAYTITILPAPAISYTLLTAATCLRNAKFNLNPSGLGAPFTILISQGPGDTIQTLTGVFSTVLDSLPSGSYTITIRSSSGGCTASIPLLIAYPPTFTTTGTFTSPTFCGLNNGTITLHHLPPGYPDTIKYLLNAILQPPLVRIPAADSTVILTGLAAGVYSSLTVTYGNCISIPIGPFVLVNPPALPARATIISPSYCGHNDGSITIKGLVPGFTDTIKYYFNGILQPYYVHVVASDSTIILTGLTAGLYSSITATYGPCATTPIDPFSLVNPPIPVPTATFTNPTYCGHNDGTITISNLHAGDLDTIKYYYNSVLQPPVVLLVSASGTVALTGLLAGVYSNITATYGPCVTAAVGPYTLVNPPIPTPTGSFTNPSYCGHNDGTITIGNLHAGDLDTIRYYYNSVLQPATVHLVTAAGTVLLTGLPAGTYSGITASYGPCVTSALGPFVLAAPPLLVPTATFINPTYCGHNDGSITISNLHPGDVDTFNFTRNGIAQTPRSLLVSAAGTVVLTGLLSGVYNNITATYGPCVTTAIGPFTLVDPPILIPTATFTSPTYCAATNGSITITNLHPGDADTIRYTLNGVLQPAVVLTVNAAGSVTLTGLLAGLYTDIYAKFGVSCITDSLGPFNLVNPPFTLRKVTYTNPTKCGFCDGTLTFYGLHPAQTDTFRFSLNGVAQPLVSASVPSDSTVVITGLCEGVYSNIVVNTTSACVSNTFGPDTLVAPPIIPGFTFNLIKNCSGDTIICTNTSWPAATLTYTWYWGDGTTDTATNPTHIYLVPGIYPIKLVITNTKCYDSVTHTVVLDNLINAGFTANPDSFLCVGSPVTFTNTSLGTSLTYLWDFGDGITDTNTNTSHIYTHIGNYHIVLTVTNYVPCIDTAMALVEVDSMSGITMTVSDSVLCKGGAVTFAANYSLNGNTGILWHFSTGDSMSNVNPVTHSYENTGLFTVSAEAFYRACPDTSVSRTVLVIPYPFVDLGADTSICPGSAALTLMDNINAANPNARWLWNTGQTTPNILVAEPGEYTVKVNVNGCESSDIVIVENDCYLNIPNIFTPNGDGINDYFVPRSLMARGLTEFHMSIFNRWGQIIFETTAIEGRGWDGKFNGILQPEGVFVYNIDATFKDGQKEHHQGNLTLMH